MAVIRVQLVKYIVHLLGGTVWPATGGAGRRDCSMSGDVSRVGSHSGHLPAARIAIAVTAEKMTMACRMSRGIFRFMRVSFDYGLRLPQSCIMVWPVRRLHLGRYGKWRRAAWADRKNFHRFR
jgi:hypothetical protein